MKPVLAVRVANCETMRLSSGTSAWAAPSPSKLSWTRATATARVARSGEGSGEVVARVARRRVVRVVVGRRVSFIFFSGGWMRLVGM